MESEIKESVRIAISLIAFGVFLSFVVVITGLASDVRVEEQNRVGLKTELQAKRELYHLTNTVVTGEDMLLLLKKYNGTYNVRIISSDRGLFPSKLLTATPSTDWDTVGIRKHVGDGNIAGSFSVNHIPPEKAPFLLELYSIYGGLEGSVTPIPVHDQDFQKKYLPYAITGDAVYDNTLMREYHMLLPVINDYAEDVIIFDAK